MKKIYFFICFFYNRLFTHLENLFLFNEKKILEQSNILSIGYELLDFNQKYLIKKKEKEIKLNNYMIKHILKKDDIYESLFLFFNKYNFKKIITEKTGYEYSVDYIIHYTTFRVPVSESHKDLYANKWHNDKPFSKNTLKIIIPMNETENYNGGIEILNFKQTKLYKNGNFDNNENYFTMNNRLNKILLFLPNRCLHKAGNPKIDEGRSQIMIQLNPAERWCINKNLYQKQYKIEPKFPYFSYLFDGKIYL